MDRKQSLALWRTDRQAWTRNYYAYSHIFSVQDRISQAQIRFVETPAQMRLNDLIDQSEAEARPTRVIVLKSRRVGISTGTITRFTHRLATRRGTRNGIVAQEKPTAVELQNFSEALYDAIPNRVKVAKTSFDEGEIYRLAGGGYSRSATAKTIGAFRGTGLTNLLLTEYAHYPDAGALMTSMNALVPDTPGTMILKESTANGVGNDFHRSWVAAEKGLGGYDPLFISWLDDPMNYVKTKLTKLEPRDEIEQVLIEIMHATPGQVLWRRKALETYEDLSQFQQEYPHTAGVAFRTSGTNYFGNLTLDRIVPVKPLGRFSTLGAFARKQAVSLVRDHVGHWHVFEPREDHTRYVIAVDPMGDITDKDLRAFAGDANAARDHAAMVVMNCKTQQPVAWYHAQVGTDKLAEQACIASTVWNRAILCPENAGGYGLDLIGKIREIGRASGATPPLHHEQRRGQKKERELEFIGFRTDPLTRPIILANLKRIARQRPEVLKFAALKAEMGTFSEGIASTPRADRGCHDDLVMVTAIGFEVAKRYAQTTVVLKRREDDGEGRILRVAPTMAGSR